MTPVSFTVDVDGVQVSDLTADAVQSLANLMIYIGHPLISRSFKKALVSRPNPGCTVCMCMYVATQLHMYNCTIYTIVFCVRVYTYMCMYCIRIRAHVLHFIELM